MYKDTFNSTIQTLQTLAQKKGIDYRLEHLIPILNELGNPHKSCPNIIHVAGTNGKGSTVAFMASIAREAKLNVGTYMSPHLECYTERIQCNHEPISKEAFCSYFKKIRPFMNKGLTEFEVLTLMTILYFADSKLDICLFETGLGGRLDATNCLMPDCCVITTIAKDHEAFLGNTLSKIASEKAGIIKPNVPCVTTTTQHPEVSSVLRHYADKQHTTLHEISPLNTLPEDTVLAASYQCINASLAIKAMQIVCPSLSDQIIRDGIKKAMHWGRMSRFKQGEHILTIDAAHNPSGLSSLVQEYAQDNTSRTVIFGLNKNKSLDDLLPYIERLGNHFLYCEFDSQWAVPYEDIKQKMTVPVTPFLLEDAIPDQEDVIITGSIYFLGKVKSKISK